jgi:hypothetical protein
MTGFVRWIGWIGLAALLLAGLPCLAGPPTAADSNDKLLQVTFRHTLEKGKTLLLVRLKVT